MSSRDLRRATWLVLRPGTDTQPAVLCCEHCGRKLVLDPGLPFVNQSASFATDHRCGELEGDVAGRC